MATQRCRFVPKNVKVKWRTKTKVFLAGILIHLHELVLMDEPSNHLDTASRQLLYDFIHTTSSTLIIVSHDRKLLNLLDTVYELNHHEVKAYGGNCDFYSEQKQIKNNALSQDLNNEEKVLRKAKEKEKETLERRQKLDSRGKKKAGKVNIDSSNQQITAHIDCCF